jgi:photoactive yellow protein
MPITGGGPDFDEPRLAEAVEKLSPERADALPFGAVRLDAEGRVVFFSKSEEELSGFRKQPIGLPFFTQIAPCMNNPAFLGRIERALAAGKLDIAFSHVGDFGDSSRELDVRVQSATDGGFWIFLRRED